MPNQDALLDAIRDRLLAMPLASFYNLTHDNLVRRLTPSKETPKVLPLIALYVSPQSTEPWADIDNIELYVEIYAKKPLDAEDLQGAIAGRAFGLHLYETVVGDITIWKCRHKGGMPSPMHDDDTNCFVADAQFEMTYG